MEDVHRCHRARAGPGNLRLGYEIGMARRSRSLGPLLLERATMQDVAEAAGVSPKTVSRVINLEHGVSDATVTRVHNAIAELGYRRNDLARNLRKGISLASVGMVLEAFANPIGSGIAQAVDEVAQRNGRELLLTSSGGDLDRERQLVTDLLRRGVEGLLVIGATDDYRYLEPDIRLGTRVVFLHREPIAMEADIVSVDNRLAARRAVEHLAAYGHQRLAFMRSAEASGRTSGRLEGFLDAISSLDLQVDDSLVRAVPPTRESAEAAVRLLLARPDPPTGVVTEDGQICSGVVWAVRRSELPLAVVGIEEFDAAELLGVSVVGYDPHEIGRAGAELLFSRLAGDSRPPQRIDIPTRLVARGSGEVVAALTV